MLGMPTTKGSREFRQSSAANGEIAPKAVIAMRPETLYNPILPFG
jgi:hypothetical protein